MATSSTSLKASFVTIPQTVTDDKLRKMNIGAGVLHFVQGFLMLGASQGVQSIRDFSKDVTTNYLVYDEATQSLVSGTKVVGSFQVGLSAAIFLLMSGLAHAMVLLNWETYIRDLERQINRFRWYEYALSSSLMIMAIAVLFGVYDLGSLILIFACNACMNLFGLLHERMNPPEREAVNWEPFIFGCFAGLVPWIVVWMYFLGGGNFDQIPGFVYGILVAYLIFFNTFPINMVLQYKRIGKRAEYRYGELCYIFLSLFAKSLLAWLVFGGTFQPNGDD